MWSVILNNSLISETEAEDIEQERIYQAFSMDKQREMKYENWKRVFDVTPLDNTWMRRGSWIQADFWSLTSEMIKDVKIFHSSRA